MKIKVDGQVWALTLAPPAQTVKSGSRDAKFLSAPRSPRTVIAASTRKISRSKPERITYNGKTYNVYPNRT